MSTLERHLRRAASDLHLARAALAQAIAHASSEEEDAIRFMVEIVHQLEKRIGKLHERRGG